MTVPPSEHFRRSVVITAFDEPSKTDRCVADLLESGSGFGLIVVDHGHQSWTPTNVRKPRLQIVHASPELWWAGATNAGVEHALALGAESIMLLNPDCVLVGSAAETLFAISAERQAIVAPTQTDLTTGLTICAGAVPLLSLGFPTLFERRHTGGWADERAIVCGGRGVVIPRAVFETVGLLAANELPHYWADHDFYLRSRKHGHPMVTVDEVRVGVDGTRTSQAAGTSRMSWAEFRASLSEPRSHRNMPSIRSFFRRNYPIRPLHWIGSGLYVTRYLMSWAARRLLTRNNL